MRDNDGPYPRRRSPHRHPALAEVAPMTVRVSCPECSTELDADPQDVATGQRRCPHCGRSLRPAEPLTPSSVQAETVDRVPAGTDEESLTALLVRWQELREEGHDSSPEEICADRTDLLPEFRRRI